MAVRNAGIRDVKTGPHIVTLPEVLSWLFAGEPVSEVVATRVCLTASPETVWDRIMFYEEVPGRPPFPLRAFMPHPVRTDGEKSMTGAKVRCLYKNGDLVKRITAVEPQRFIRFEVIEQCLGVEDCVTALGGSYEIHRHGDGSDIVLTTRYRAYLHPRFFWHPLERLVTTQLHKHVLNGMRGCLPENSRTVRLSIHCVAPQRAAQETVRCTISESHSQL